MAFAHLRGTTLSDDSQSTSGANMSGTERSGADRTGPDQIRPDRGTRHERTEPDQT